MSNRTVDIHSIQTHVDYQEALHEIEALMSAEPGTEAGRRLEALTRLVEEYERRFFPIEQ